MRIVRDRLPDHWVVAAVWGRRANLSRIYEELVREWILPAELAVRLGEDLGAAEGRQPR